MKPHWIVRTSAGAHYHSEVEARIAAQTLAEDTHGQEVWVYAFVGLARLRPAEVSWIGVDSTEEVTDEAE